MTFLQIVNEVLTRLRQDTVDTVISPDDEAAKMVITLVNDAKTKCENAWDWNGLRTDWDLVTVTDQSVYELPDSDTYVKIDNVSNDTWAYFLNQTTPMHLKKKKWGNNPDGKPEYFTVDGSNASRDVKIEMWPTPEADQNVTVTGWKNQPMLAADGDVLTIPALPVIYEALALAARERGEVGGQTALEIFGVAKKHLEDAVALDSALSPLDNIWYSV